MAQPVLFTVNGTGAPGPFDPGFAGDMGRAMTPTPEQVFCDKLDGIDTEAAFFWQPIGYPAAVFPMQESQLAAQNELSRLFGVHEQSGLCPPGTPVALSGYSQGAIAVAQFWRDHILNPAGQHHNRLADVVGIVQFGDPLRCPGIAHGNEIAGLPAPSIHDGQVTGGIAGPDCLTPEQTPDFYVSCALDGDLYAAAPVGSNPWTAEPEVGCLETRIYDFVVHGTWDAFMANVGDLADIFRQPVDTIIAAAQAIFNGMTFFAAGTNAPHWQYQCMFPAVADWLKAQV